MNVVFVYNDELILLFLVLLQLRKLKFIAKPI